MADMDMKLLLPFPPTTNSLWRAVKGRNIKSKKYREWQKVAGHALNEQFKGDAIPGPVVLTLRFGRPNKRRQDLDNRLKAPIDLLAAHGVIDDDRNVQSILAYWSSTVEGVEIEVWRA